ncbi:MAG: hypothetical protein HZB51_11460 [Chloroflexi bacterium]|nr:hypothetical protein [Chloroflexota bacterium]
MDNAVRLEELVQKMLNETQGAKNKRVRVVNLSVYDQSIDPLELTRVFKSVTFNTPAQDAQLHVRRSENTSKDSTHNSPSSTPFTPVRLDSLELEDASIPKS